MSERLVVSVAVVPNQIDVPLGSRAGVCSPAQQSAAVGALIDHPKNHAHIELLTGPTDKTDLTKVHCSCGGFNENCYKCAGWGYIDSISARAATLRCAPATLKKPSHQGWAEKPKKLKPETGLGAQRAGTHAR